MTLLLGTNDLDQVVELLRSGNLVAFPTETVYGLGADASNPDAVARVFEAKGRPAGHPLIVHLGSTQQMLQWATDVDDRALALADAFWPGPLTLIVPSSGRATSEVTGDRSTIGLRVPNHPVTLDVLTRFGGGLAGPSANRFGHVSPTSAQHVMADLDGRIDAVLDGGSAQVGVESTIVEVLRGCPVAVLRPGGVSVDEISALLGEDVIDGRSSESRAAGMLASHYAPIAPVVVIEAAAPPSSWPADTVVIGPESTPIDPSQLISVPLDSAGFARSLYAALREADAREPATIAVVAPAEGVLSEAVRDRLSKASSPRE